MGCSTSTECDDDGRSAAAGRGRGKKPAKKNQKPIATEEEMLRNAEAVRRRYGEAHDRVDEQVLEELEEVRSRAGSSLPGSRAESFCGGSRAGSTRGSRMTSPVGTALVLKPGFDCGAEDDDTAIFGLPPTAGALAGLNRSSSRRSFGGGGGNRSGRGSVRGGLSPSLHGQSTVSVFDLLASEDDDDEKVAAAAAGIETTAPDAALLSSDDMAAGASPAPHHPDASTSYFHGRERAPPVLLPAPRMIGRGNAARDGGERASSSAGSAGSPLASPNTRSGLLQRDGGSVGASVVGSPNGCGPLGFDTADDALPPGLVGVGRDDDDDADGMGQVPSQGSVVTPASRQVLLEEPTYFGGGCSALHDDITSVAGRSGARASALVSPVGSDLSSFRWQSSRANVAAATASGAASPSGSGTRRPHAPTRSRSQTPLESMQKKLLVPDAVRALGSRSPLWA